MTTLQDIRALDAQDPLRALRDQFEIAEGTIYLDGNSLGAMPRSAPARVAQVVTQEWGTDLIRSWNSAGWFELPRKVGDQIARLIGIDQRHAALGQAQFVDQFVGTRSHYIDNRIADGDNVITRCGHVFSRAVD